MRKFPLFHMAGIQDVFPREGDYSWIKGNQKMNIAKMYKATSKRHLAIQIYHVFMKRVLEDMIENRKVFEFPAYSAALVIEQMPMEVFESLRGQGKLQFYSTLFNQGRVYLPVYRYKKRGACRRFRVILGKEMFKQLTEKVNQGVRYLSYTMQW